jgi:hypothetical protein
VTFLRRMIRHFGYVLRIVQTNYGQEFSYFKETERVHPFDRECERLGIVQELRGITAKWKEAIEPTMNVSIQHSGFIATKTFKNKAKDISTDPTELA